MGKERTSGDGDGMGGAAGDGGDVATIAIDAGIGDGEGRSVGDILGDILGTGSGSGGFDGDIGRTAGRRGGKRGKRRQQPAEVADLPADFVGVKAPAGRKGGKASPIPSDGLAALFQTLSTLAASRWGAVWALAPDESAALGETTAGVLRHVPVKSKRVGPLVDGLALAGVTLMVVGPRLAYIKAEAAQRQQPAEAAAYQQNGAGPTPIDWGLNLGSRA